MSQYDLIVIGAGPGGYVAAIRAAQLGMKVACVESERALGGTCLRVGCIPSKALLESSELYERTQHDLSHRGINVKGVSVDLPQMIDHKQSVVKALTGGIDSLFKKNKITRLVGHGSLLPGKKVLVKSSAGEEQVEGKQILIATGSVPSTLPGIEIDGNRVMSSTEALDLKEIPKHLVVIGGGYIGLEMGTVWRRLGAKVTVLEYLDRILPGLDAEIANQAHKLFAKQGINFQLGMKVAGVKATAKQCEVKIEGQSSVKCDRVLVSVGRKPCTHQLGLEEVGVATDKRGFIPVDANYQTNIEGVYAIGDVIGGAMLAHKAEEEGIACVEKLATGYGHVNYDVIPAVVYTDPEIASVGRHEEQLKEQNVEYKVGKFPFLANGRAKAIGHTDGFVKVLADAKTDRVLGVHIIGPHAGELIAECTAAMEFGASSEDIARTCHSHPTLSEAVKEAALAVEKRAIHF